MRFAESAGLDESVIKWIDWIKHAPSLVGFIVASELAKLQSLSNPARIRSFVLQNAGVESSGVC